jgi:hypothetical protein
MRELRLLPALVLLSVLVGCQCADPPADRFVAIDRVNDNLEQVDQTLYCSGLASFRFRDAESKTRRVPLRDARLFWRTPDRLRFDVKSNAGVIAQLGSQEVYYWMWIEPEINKLWIGSWEKANHPDTRRLAIPPDQLVTALMLGPIPPSLEGGELPKLKVKCNDHRLVFTRRTPDGTLIGTREIRVQERAPFQPIEIIDRAADGTVLMEAELSNYRRVGDDGPWTARKYIIEWPQDGAKLRLDIHRAKFRSDLPDDIFDPPLEWQGEIELLDALDESASRSCSRAKQAS